MRAPTDILPLKVYEIVKLILQLLLTDEMFWYKMDLY